MAPRRAIGVIAAPGDRRDADIQELAAIAADTFDRSSCAKTTTCGAASRARWRV